MSLTETTILLKFHTFCVNSLVFCQIIVTLFTICTCQCDFYSHNFHLRHINLYFFLCANASVKEKFAHKKKASTCVARSRITETLEKVNSSLTFLFYGTSLLDSLYCYLTQRQSSLVNVLSLYYTCYGRKKIISYIYSVMISISHFMLS